VQTHPRRRRISTDLPARPARGSVGRVKKPSPEIAPERRREMSPAQFFAVALLVKLIVILPFVILLLRKAFR
jgi:hypothetical protein